MKQQRVSMRSTYKLIWSDEALEGLKLIFAYLENRFSEKDVKKFAQNFEKQIELITTNPENFPFVSKFKDN